MIIGSKHVRHALNGSVDHFRGENENDGEYQNEPLGGTDGIMPSEKNDQQREKQVHLKIRLRHEGVINAVPCVFE